METLEEILEDSEKYRDSIATVDKEGKRIWIHPKKPKGKFHNWRIVVAILILGSFFVIPFIKVGGHEFFLINIFERKFILFGNVFMPQDFHLFAIGLITFFVMIILFTVVYGRFFCGWACPQTLFMEMVFRKIEYFFEGDANQQRKLNARNWDTDKILRKSAKIGLYAIISIIVGHVSMSYLIGVDKVVKVVTQPPTENLAGFIAVVVFSGLYFMVFTYLREQVCIAICPYGRLQGVLLGKDSIVVAYDFVRGEPRGRLKRKKETDSNNTRKLSIEDFEKPQGDCIDCGLCVQVCPTGIDIRNGTQLECVNCTACIDACDNVMEKVGKPKGLIRYASYNNIANKTKFKFTPRIIAYTSVLLVLLSLEAFLLIQRPEAEATILRVPGSLYEEQANGDITNIYTVQVANKTFEDMKITFKLKDSKGNIKVGGSEISVLKNTASSGTIIVTLPKEELKGLKTKISIEVWSGDKLIETVSTNFLGPA